jgi:hypothetical protein
VQKRRHAACLQWTRWPAGCSTINGRLRRLLTSAEKGELLSCSAFSARVRWSHLVKAVSCSALAVDVGCIFRLPVISGAAQVGSR